MNRAAVRAERRPLLLPVCASAPDESTVIRRSVNAPRPAIPAPTTKMAAQTRYRRSVQRQRGDGRWPSGKSRTGSGSKRTKPIQPDVRKTASRASGSQ